MGKSRKPLDERTHLSTRMDDDIRRLLREIWQLQPGIKDDQTVTIKSALYAYLASLKGITPVVYLEPDPLIEPEIEASEDWQGEDP